MGNTINGLGLTTDDEVVVGIRDAVDVDDDVEELWKMDRARILLKTPWPVLIQHTVRVHIQGEVFTVRVI